MITDEKNSPVPMAHIALYDSFKGAVSDANGMFELCGLVHDSVQIVVGHTSFYPQTIWVFKSKNEELNVKLQLKVLNTKEIEVVAHQKSIVSSYIPGKLNLSNKDILSIPGFMGSPDVLRSLQLLPGMQSVSEGNSGIYVRGGSPGQNYVLFDDIELMNPTHLMGIYSVFNPLLTDRVEFFKGNAPVHQSSRLASSILVSTQNRKTEESNWAGNIGNIITNLTYTGASSDNKWFFSTGFRRSYLDVLGYMAQPFLSDEDNYFKSNQYNFYDWNGKLNYSIGNSNLSLSWYLGNDHFFMTNEKHRVESFSDWGNQGVALVWKYLFKPNLSMNNTVSYSGYQSDFGAELEDGNMRFKTDYQQLQLKNSFVCTVGNSIWRWGMDASIYNVTPQNLEIAYVENSDYRLNEYTSLAVKPFLSNQYALNDQWTIYGGLALMYYKVQNVSGTSGQNTNDKAQIKPNVVSSVSYHPSHSSSVKASYAFNTQNIHLASIASIPLPSDIWMPSTTNLPLEFGHQFTLGYFKFLEKYNIQWGVEAYAKWMKNQLLLKLNVNNVEVEQFDENFYRGEAMAWGSEFYLNKQKGQFNFTVGYTLGWTKQRFDGINDGEWHDAKYDRRHDVNLQMTYQHNKKIDFGAVFIYASGNKATLPTGRYWIMGSIANDYAGVNNYRMPSYHRLDLSMNYHLESKVFNESVLSFSIINLYNRSNAYYIYYAIEGGEKDYEMSIKAKQVSLFPIMPSVSWRFKF
ncbi:TonB-dependent receptor [Carboxylicivirga linearis]|uniref:TonB-dependent receptor n=1 Tax=Carboxylicivirga linearis TaxID=1628157 RepID=UPI0021D46511|nr:TonB-dependent receptor [Carboxylicivirga linearis]